MKYDLGIDLGTTYSCLAIIDPDTNEPNIVRNSLEHETTPSVIVYTEEEGFVVGELAKDMNGFIDPDNYIEAIKRSMSDVDIYPAKNFGGKDYGPIELSAEIIKKMLRDFREKYPEADLDGITITCPAYFGMMGRTATKNAAILAVCAIFGKNYDEVEVNLLEEPIASAIHYGLTSNKKKTILVYDLGGGSFDVTIMKTRPDGLKVIGTNGDSMLGGKDWDAALIEIIKDKVAEAGNIEPEEIEADDNAMLTIRKDAEQEKITLSVLNEVKGFVMIGPSSIKYKISREEFESATMQYLDVAKDRVQKLLDHLSMTMDDIDDVILVGGSARMPMVKAKLISDFPGCETKIHYSEPDLVIAKGAAIYQKNQQELFPIPEPPIPPTPPREKSLASEIKIYIDDEEKIDQFLIGDLVIQNARLPIRNTYNYSFGHDSDLQLHIQTIHRDLEPSGPAHEIRYVETGNITIPIPMKYNRAEDSYFSFDVDVAENTFCKIVIKELNQDQYGKTIIRIDLEVVRKTKMVKRCGLYSIFD